MNTIEVSAGAEVATRILIRPGLTAAPAVRSVLRSATTEPHRIAVFGQPGSALVAGRVADALDAPLRLLPDREAAKRLTVVEECYEWLNSLGFTRSDVVIGVGGGALTDAVGFVAATYLRGLPVAFVPTTLLGAVDAAIGGKSAINVGGKNLAGAFRHPQQVLIDIDILAALPEALLLEGAAEAIKAGFIGDAALVELYERDGMAAPLDEVVTRAVQVKAGIVSADFEESGPRAFLNYGHTLGHAIETAAGISHGEAVAIGMVAAAAVSARRLGFTASERQRHLLDRVGLPTEAPAVDREEIRRLVSLDKKRDASGVRMTLLRSIADPLVIGVDETDLGLAMETVGIR